MLPEEQGYGDSRDTPPPPSCLGTTLRKNRPLVPRSNSPTTFFYHIVWGLAHVFNNKLFFTRDIVDDDAVPKHFNVPEPKPKPAPKPKAAPKPGPKGQHRQVFRMVYHMKKGFTSEPVEHWIIPCSLEGTLQPSQLRFSPLVFICQLVWLWERRGHTYPRAMCRKIFSRGTGLLTVAHKNQPLVARSNFGGKACAGTNP